MTINTIKTTQLEGRFQTNNYQFNRLFAPSPLSSSIKDDFVVDYWTSKLSNDPFAIKNIESPETKHHLSDALTGIHKNVDVTKTITFFDYLKDSQDEKERKTGQKMYDLVTKIINVSIKEGSLSHISRANLTPIIDFQGRKIALDKLSSGNLYLIQRFTHLLKQMYSVCDIHNIPIDNIQEIPGLLLIDEAENHLHPQWQKVFVKNIIRLFPNLQIIITTHSPFIVSSVENSRIYVCSSQGDHSIVKEETDFYANAPIEEILISPLFNTNSFNVEISGLLSKRKEAIKANDETSKQDIEERLLALNPEYFSYLNIDKIIANITR
jgi:predicted ATP-binding protein involved in virulence